MTILPSIKNWASSIRVLSNVLKTRPVAESEKLLIHGSLVGPMIEPRLNR